MNLLSSLERAYKGENEILGTLETMRAKNFRELVERLTDTLQKGAAQEVVESELILFVKNSICSRRFGENLQLNQRWTALPDATKQSAKAALLKRLQSGPALVVSASTQLIASIGKIELSRGEWDGLVAFLCEALDHKGSVVKVAALGVVNALLDESSPADISLAQVVYLTSAVVRCCNPSTKPEEPTLLHGLGALRSLVKHLDHLFTDPKASSHLMHMLLGYSSPAQPDRVRWAAADCLLEITELFYHSIGPYFPAYLSAARQWLRGGDNRMARNGVELLRLVGEIERSIQKSGRCGRATSNGAPGTGSLRLIETNFSAVSNTLLVGLLSREECDEYDEWGTLNAASEAFDTVVQCADLAQSVAQCAPLIRRCLTASEPFPVAEAACTRLPLWRYRGAGLRMLAALCTATDKAMKRHVRAHAAPPALPAFNALLEQVFPLLLAELDRSVRAESFPPFLVDAAMRCTGKIIAHQRGRKEAVAVIERILPQIAYHLCSPSALAAVQAARTMDEILEMLGTTESAESRAYIAGNFRQVFGVLISSSARVGPKVRASFMQTMVTTLAHSPPECRESAAELLPVLADGLRRALNAEDDSVAGFCELLPLCVYKAGAARLDVRAADGVMSALTEGALRPASTSEGMRGLGVIAAALGVRFARYAPPVVPLLLNAATKPFDDDTVVAALDGLQGVVRGLGRGVAPFAATVLATLEQVLSSELTRPSVKPRAVEVLGELVGAAGADFLRRHGGELSPFFVGLAALVLEQAPYTGERMQLAVLRCHSGLVRALAADAGAGAEAAAEVRLSTPFPLPQLRAAEARAVSTIAVCPTALLATAPALAVLPSFTARCAALLAGSGAGEDVRAEALWLIGDLVEAVPTSRLVLDTAETRAGVDAALADPSPRVRRAAEWAGHAPPVQ